MDLKIKITDRDRDKDVLNQGYGPDGNDSVLTPSPRGPGINRIPTTRPFQYWPPENCVTEFVTNCRTSCDEN